MPMKYTCACAACASTSFKWSGETGQAPTAAPANPILNLPYTGDYRIDTLLQDPSFRWNAPSTMGTAVSVSFSFMTVKPSYGGTDSGTDTGFTPFTVEQMAAVRQIFTRLNAELGIRFEEMPDSATSYGQVRFGNNLQKSSAGYAYLPGSTGDDKSGDVWIDSTTASNTTNLTVGTHAYATMVHEIGHAIGLKHPGNYNAGEVPDPNVRGNFLGVKEDNTHYSIMSYNDGTPNLQRDWFGMYDMLTLRTLYGSGTPNSGNSTYSYGDSAGAVLSLIVDSGGIDTIDVSAATVGATVNLGAGTFSSVGRTNGAAAANNLSIDLSAQIENFIGTALNDTVIGNSANNSFTLGGGVNTANGAAGTDTAIYAAAKSSYQIVISTSSVTVTGSNNTDTLTSVERLTFSDRKLAVDVSGNAGTTAKILGAVFGKAAVANTGYMGIGLNLLDSGTTYVNLMQAALNAKLGAGASDTAVVTLYFTNLTGAAPGAADLANYTGLIANGTFTQASLGVLAADHVLNTTNINLVGLAATGIEFV